jgi:hypothetical protein
MHGIFTIGLKILGFQAVAARNNFNWYGRFVGIFFLNAQSCRRICSIFI